MVGAFETHHRNSTCGCNNICKQTLNRTCADYTREAVLWTTSLPKIEGKRPGSLDRIELVAIDELLHLFLRHRLGLAHNLHSLLSIDHRAIEGDTETAFIQCLLNLSHVNRAVIFGARLCSNCIHGHGHTGEICIRRDVEEGKR